MDRKLEIKEYTYKGLSINYRAGTEDELVLNHSFENDIFFKEIPSFSPSIHPVIVDVGAHIGTFSLLSSIRYPNARLYAYEASLETFNILEANKRNNKIDRLYVLHAAVARSKGKLKLFHSEKTGNWGHSITKQLSNSFEEVNSITLESIIMDNDIPFIDLIKFNCEGAEFEILFNTPHEIIKKIGLAIILYHEDLDSKNGNSSALSNLFGDLGFRVMKIAKSETRGWLIVWNKSKYSFLYFAFRAIRRKLKM